MLNTRPDVTLGGGAASFAEQATAGKWKGQTLRAQAKARGFRIVENLEALQAVKGASQQQPLLGLFSPGNMPVRWNGPKASHGGAQAEPITCQLNPPAPPPCPIWRR